MNENQKNLRKKRRIEKVKLKKRRREKKRKGINLCKL